MASYGPEVVRLTHKMGSNSRLRMTERGMTGDEPERGHGLSPKRAQHVPTSHV